MMPEHIRDVQLTGRYGASLYAAVQELTMPGSPERTKWDSSFHPRGQELLALPRPGSSTPDPSLVQPGTGRTGTDTLELSDTRYRRPNRRK